MMQNFLILLRDNSVLIFKHLIFLCCLLDYIYIDVE